MTFGTFTDDVVAWIEKFKRDFRFSDFGIIGHSEGSMITMVISYRRGIHANVSISGTGKPILKTLLDQLNRQKRKGAEEVGRIINTLEEGDRLVIDVNVVGRQPGKTSL